MTAPLFRSPRALRLALLALAMFAVLARPIYGTWCETHQVGHQLAGLGHHDFREDSSLERQLDAGHERGEHGQVHSDDGGVYADTAAAVILPVVQFISVMNPLEVVLPHPVQRVSALFRPPIA